MSVTRTQQYAGHRRFLPLYHFVALPILGLHFVFAASVAWKEPTAWNAWQVVLSLGLIATLLASRQMALIVQDRVIRLEMRQRLREVLPAPLAARIGELRVRHLVGLRFAGEAEMAGLVERCLSGELRTSDQVKRQITDWQPDFLRA